MLIAPAHPDEPRRLEALRRYRILDTEAEEGFDDITKLASYICGTPIALVSLVDADRQWFKSRVGLEPSQTPRNVAFCAHAILQDEVFEVPDAHGDERFADNPLVTSDPHVRFYAGTPLTTPSGYPVGTLCVIDQTPRTLTPEQADALRSLGHQVVSQLELRLKLQERSELVAELERSRAALESSNTSLQEFASVASHDLQEPLRKLLAFGDRLRAALGDQLPARANDYLSRMENASQRMQQLINDLLRLSRVSTRCEPFRSVDLDEVVRGVLADLEVNIESSRATVDVGRLPTLHAEPSQMRQLLQNLVGNALKFRKGDEPPRVSVTAEVLTECEALPLVQAPVVKLVIADEGIGFDLSFAARIFQVFERLHGRSEYEGTGIGLAICQRIVEHHRGRIVAASAPGEGATFTVYLPQCPSESPASHHGTQRTAGADGDARTALDEPLAIG